MRQRNEYLKMKNGIEKCEMRVCACMSVCVCVNSVKNDFYVQCAQNDRCKVIGIGRERMHIYFLYIYVYAYIATQI